MSTNPFDAPSIEETPAKPANPDVLPTSAHVMAGWPLLLVAVGGLIGALLGFGAYSINLKIYKSDMPAALKVVLNIGVGLVAIVLWITASTALVIAINGMPRN